MSHQSGRFREWRAQSGRLREWEVTIVTKKEKDYKDELVVLLTNGWDIGNLDLPD